MVTYGQMSDSEEKIKAPDGVRLTQKGLPDKRRLFQPGHTGNALGRPRLDTVLRQAARLEGLECIRQLVEIRDNSKSEKVKLMAIGMILDRGFGKVREAPEPEDSKIIDLQEVKDADIDKVLE